MVGVDAAPGHGSRGARDRGVDARLADGAALPFAREFDAVFSNAALHWMSADPDAVVAGVARALRPGGRFVGEFGGHGNVAAIIVALQAALGAPRHRRRRADPLVLPDAGRVSRAASSGTASTVGRIELIPRPTPLPTGMAAWLETFADPFLRPIPDSRAGRGCAPRRSSCCGPCPARQ